MENETQMATNYWQWISYHPFLTAIIILSIIFATIEIINRILRAINIKNAGWPPNHLDADGSHMEKVEDKINYNPTEG